MAVKSPIDFPIIKVIFSLVLFICLWGQFDRDEWTPDEPRVVAISMEMAETGNVIIPHLAGAYFIEKPPLYFALSAGAISALPFLEPIIAVRNVNAILALLTLYFTFLLGKEIKDRETGYLAAVVLGTMEGFVIQTHWSRVDNLLILTIIAASWAFYYAFKHQQHRYILLGSLFTGLSFLSKGFIGVVMIGAIWLAAALSFSIEYLQGKRKNSTTFHFSYYKVKNHILIHITGLAVFTLVAGTWIYLLKKFGTEDIWHEWFWVNHVGRFSGTAQGLGHVHPGQPFYYLKAIMEYSLPWLPILIAAVFLFVTKTIKKAQIETAELFMILSLGITVTLLTISDTKRSLYLFPLLPLFALAVAYTLSHCRGWWTQWFQNIWLALSLVIMLALLGLPLYISKFANTIPENMLSYLSEFNWRSLLLLFSIVALTMVWRKQWMYAFYHKVVLATVLLYFCLFGVLNPPINIVKSMRQDTHDFVERIPQGMRERIADYGFGETSLSALVIEDNWKLATIDSPKRVEKILLGDDSEYDSIIIEHSGAIEHMLEGLPPSRIKAKGNQRSDKENQGIYWLIGV